MKEAKIFSFYCHFVIIDNKYGIFKRLVSKYIFILECYERINNYIRPFPVIANCEIYLLFFKKKIILAILICTGGLCKRIRKTDTNC